MLLLQNAAATLSTVPPVAPGSTASPTSFEWWSDIILPSVVGVGSVAAAVVAAFIAARSNRLARAATIAAARSNAIAKRANDLEMQRDARDAANTARAARQAFADRWSQILVELSEDVRTKRVAREKIPAAWMQSLLLALESVSRGFESFPDDAVMQMLFRAGQTEQPIVVTQVVALANALINDWVVDPERVESSVELHDLLVESVISRHKDDDDATPGNDAPAKPAPSAEA